MPYMPPVCTSSSVVSISALETVPGQMVKKQDTYNMAASWNSGSDASSDGLWFLSSSKQPEQDFSEPSSSTVHATMCNVPCTVPGGSFECFSNVKTREWSSEWTGKEECVWAPCNMGKHWVYTSGSTHLKKVLSSPSFTTSPYMHADAQAKASLYTMRGTIDTEVKRAHSDLSLGGNVSEPTGNQNLLRKKSGELVKSSLKPEKHTLSRSMPSTPILHKNVQFATKLEQIRHFFQAERPTAVSRSTSPDEKYFDTYEPAFGYDLYDFKEDDDDFVIELANFNKDEALCLTRNVQLETVYLSADKRNLLGRIAVKNLTFEKSVGVRFTMDYWQTISEVNAEYTDDISLKKFQDDFDRFIFNIKLHELVNIKDKTLYLCVRYTIPGGEFWDNNSGMNYRIEFKKKSKMHTQRLNYFRTLSSENQHLDDDINSKSDSHLFLFQPYKNNPFHLSSTSNDINTEIPFLRKKDNSNNLFSNRYDFSASLTAAIKASNTMNYNDNKSEYLKMKDNDSFDISIKNVSSYFSELFLIDNPSANLQNNIPFQNDISSTLSLSETSVSTYEENTITNDLFKDSFKPSVDSASYKNFLNSYCFFRGSDKINTQNVESRTHMNKSSMHSFPLMSYRKSMSPDSLLSTAELASFPSSFSSDTSLFCTQSQLPPIPSNDSVSSSISKQTSESKTSIDLYYSYLVNSSLGLEGPGGTLTAIQT